MKTHYTVSRGTLLIAFCVMALGLALQPGTTYPQESRAVAEQHLINSFVGRAGAPDYTGTDTPRQVWTHAVDRMDSEADDDQDYDI